MAGLLKNRLRCIGRQQAMMKIARLFSGELDETDAKKIQRWRQRHPGSEQDFADTFHLLAEMDALTEHPEYRGEYRRIAQAPVAFGAGEQLRRHGPVLAAAAGVLLLVGVVLSQFVNVAPETASEPSLKRYVTRIGEQKTIDLDDGSAITLNTGSEVLVDMGGNRRQVSLERGEAFFKVAKNSEAPFAVSIDSRLVTVLGTQFNILKTPEQFTLSVHEGVVAVHQKEEQVDPLSPELLPPKGLKSGSVGAIYTPGQRLVKSGTVAVFDSLRDRVVVSKPGHIERLLTWQNGLLRFDGQPLSKVVREFNRYTAKKILIEDASVMDEEVFATFRVDRINMALSDLEKTYPIKVVQYFDRIIIKSAER